MTLSQYYNQLRYNKKHKEDINNRHKEYYKKHKDKYADRSKKFKLKTKMTKTEVDTIKKLYSFCFRE